MKVILIEDEQHQLELLTDLLTEHFPELELAGNAANVEDGILLIKSKKPDLVFLDVMLGPDTCFDLLEGLEHIDFDLIFTTSYEKYAVKAFRLSAVDYLLKPIDPEELRSAVEKFKQKKASQASVEHIKVLLSNMHGQGKNEHRIALPVSLNSLKFVPIHEIIRCEAEKNYTTFFMDQAKEVTSKTLGYYDHLEEYNFARVHQSHLVNLDHVREYIRGEGGTLIMSDGSEIPVARRRKPALLRRLEM